MTSEEWGVITFLPLLLGPLVVDVSVLSMTLSVWNNVQNDTGTESLWRNDKRTRPRYGGKRSLSD